MKLFQIHNPDWLDQIPIQQLDPPRDPRRIRFQAGTLQELREMTEDEWEESKRKALRWQPEGRGR